MLLETKRGKENKVTIPMGTEAAQRNHTWTREGGYQEVSYVHAEYPKSLYKKREFAAPEAFALIEEIYGVEDTEERQSAYLVAMEHIGETGVDIRSWPMMCPQDAVLKQFYRIVLLHARDQMRDRWLAQNPGTGVGDYEKWAKSPEERVVNTVGEEEVARTEGYAPLGE